MSEVKGDAFMGALGVDRMEDCPVVEMEETCRWWMQSLSVEINYRSTIGSNGWSKNLERFLGCKVIIRLFLQLVNWNLASPSS